ncbi:hypothetical protein IGL98_001380 [Enterococcus sp. DIV0840]
MSTIDTIKSDAFYPARHPEVGMCFEEVYSSVGNLEIYIFLFEDYWINKKLKKQSGVGAYQNAFKEFFYFLQKNREDPVSSDSVTINSEVLRSLITKSIIRRDIKIVKELKALYDNECQICNFKLQVGRKSYYSEVHHIRPLGTPHDGGDNKENMIVVCPNCHVQLDRGFQKLNKKSLNIKSDHKVNAENISYYNGKILN